MNITKYIKELEKIRDECGDYVFLSNDDTCDWVQIIETEDGNLENGRDITSSYELR